MSRVHIDIFFVNDPESRRWWRKCCCGGRLGLDGDSRSEL